MVKKEDLNSASYKVTNSTDAERGYNIKGNATFAGEKMTGIDSGSVIAVEGGAMVADFSVNATHFWCNIYGEDADRAAVVKAILGFYEECRELAAE